MSLELSRVETKETAILIVRLRNVGTEPITVDRELVFLVDVICESSDGSSIMDKRFRATEVDPPSYAKSERFILVPPGRTVSRTIDLRKGIREFRWGHMHSVDDVDGQIIHRHRRTYGWEEIYPLQAGEQVKRIVVRYGMRYSESDDEMYRTEFFRHVGVDPASLKNLYDGPLESSIDWDG